MTSHPPQDNPTEHIENAYNIWAQELLTRLRSEQRQVKVGEVNELYAELRDAFYAGARHGRGEARRADTPNPTEEQTSLAEAFSHLNDDVEGRAVAWLDAEVQRLQAEVQAGKELYWALQGGLEHCPWCESGSLQHVTECPVSKYLVVVSPAYREALDG